MNPPLKKRQKVFLDDESSEDSTNVWNSNDDADDDTISDKGSVGGGDDSLSDSADSDLEELFKRGRKKSSVSGEELNNDNTKKKTPEMIVSPLSVEDDGTKFDDELDFTHMNTQESNPNMTNKLLTQQNNIDILDVKNIGGDSIQHPVELDDSDNSLEEKKGLQKKKKKESKSKRKSTEVKSSTKESQTSKKQSSSNSPTSKSNKSKLSKSESETKDNKKISPKKETKKKSKTEKEMSSKSKSTTKAKPTEQKNTKDSTSKDTQVVVIETSTKTQVNEDSSKTVSSCKASNSLSNNANNTTNNKPAATTAAAESTKPQKKKQTFQSQVLTHLLTTLRPFTIKTLATELRTTSIALNHLMLSMIDKGIIHKREWGKNNKELYWVDLKNATKEVYGKDHVFDPKQTEDAKIELQHYRGQVQRLHNEAEAMNAQISNQELERQLKEEEMIVDGLRTRLNGAKERISGVKRNQQSNQGLSGPVMKQHRISSSMNTKPVMKNSKQIKKEFNNMRLEWKNRKQKCMDFIDNLSDAMEKKPKDVMKILDLETDEMVGVKFPPKQDI